MVLREIIAVHYEIDIYLWGRGNGTWHMAQILNTFLNG
jgi:hypothetical protein